MTKKYLCVLEKLCNETKEMYGLKFYLSDHSESQAKSHGFSYKGMRDYYKREFGYIMGFNNEELMNEKYGSKDKNNYQKNGGY